MAPWAMCLRRIWLAYLRAPLDTWRMTGERLLMQPWMIACSCSMLLIPRVLGRSGRVSFYRIRLSRVGRFLRMMKPGLWPACLLALLLLSGCVNGSALLLFEQPWWTSLGGDAAVRF